MKSPLYVLGLYAAYDNHEAVSTASQLRATPLDSPLLSHWKVTS